VEYVIEFSQDAEDHLDEFSAREQRIIVAAIEKQLLHQPDVATRNRKLLRENPLACWELRVEAIRVFYNVEDDKVLIIALSVKEGNKLFIDGKEYEL
jgi:mRNA-degrading endonuclease RelE of RelBE toxin-antitoxin system